MILRTIVFIILLALIFFVVVPVALYLAGVNIFSGNNVTPSASRQTEIPKISGILIRSEDGGSNWKSAGISENPNVAFPSAIYSFVIHPQDSNAIYLGGAVSGLWKSTNQGRTWNQVVDASGVLAPNADIYDIKIASANPDVMYVAAYQKNNGRVLKSEDGGEHFTELYVTSKNKAGVFGVIADPADKKHLLAVTGENALIETFNGGQTWRIKKLFIRPIARLIGNPRNIQELYVINADGKVFKSVTGGKDWSDEIGALPSEPVVPGYELGLFDFFTQHAKGKGEIFMLDPSNASRVYSAQGTRLVRSEDAGLTWSEVTLLFSKELLPPTALAIDPYKSSTIFVVAGDELQKSTDDGATWRNIPLPDGVRILSLIIHPKDSKIMFAVVGK